MTRDILNGKMVKQYWKKKNEEWIKNEAERSSTVTQADKEEQLIKKDWGWKGTYLDFYYLPGQRRQYHKPSCCFHWMYDLLFGKIVALSKAVLTEVDGDCVYANGVAQCNFSTPFGMKLRLCFSPLRLPLITSARTKNNFCSFCWHGCTQTSLK